jgi:hypothetical protein
MADEWYYTNQGQQKGPVSTADLKQLAASNQLQPTDLVWREGLAGWVPARSAKGLFPDAPPEMAPVAATPVAPIEEVGDYGDAAPRPRADNDYDRPRRRRRDDDDDYDEAPRRRRSRSAGSNKGLIIGLVAGGVGLVVVAVVVIVLLLVLGGGGSTSLTLTNGRATVNSALTDSDSFDSRRRPSRCKVYSITLTAGKVYDIGMSSSQIDSYLRLEDSGGAVLREDDDGGGFPNARIVFNCPRTGTYRITCTTFMPAVGPFTLSVQER